MTPNDLDTAPWWDALARGELLLQQCFGCGRFRWPPRAVCGDCWSDEAEWVPASGRGTIESWTVSHHAFGSATAVAFVVVLVRIDDQDDICIPGFVDGPQDGTTLALGLPVTVGFDGGLLRWKLGSV